MAERRMFHKAILESDEFSRQTLVSKMLYISLNLNADDEGFVGNVRKIMQGIGAKATHFSSLIDANYLIKFDSGVVVITHWHVHNKLVPGRKNPTSYLKERDLLTLERSGLYALKPSEGIVKQSDEDLPSEDSKVKDRIGKDSLGKVSVGEVREDKDNRAQEIELDRQLTELRRTIENKKAQCTKLSV